ncbi:TIGR03668 family PPOX class F420-dependent oxidoreductase [Saccharopolyspora sp. TS4A08]|uniref:TIGR03668 family PPOX class F420-dependent oxidoreductase n=1 Tax=Saccharopolyspora ipomoeae TaxID=3042027 RepID=A0ABT6PMD0_9PSEU|nr:TIGR03668 family PPOX class F420-dependent oxidoreductase [Saccharopolyspora sp. TS4A08]MDI2029094.1 TIGR03668 family PPOX class F420-dependent oxidoreductase [Saccharopolyspora sp. TS4A08]
MRISREQARDRIAAARVARLASADAAGRPHVVPIVLAAAGDELITAVDWKPKSGRELRRIRNIEENPLVSVLVDGYDEDWSKLWWARADGTAEILQEHPLLDALIAKYPQYQRKPPGGALIAVRVDRWTGWASSGV